MILLKEKRLLCGLTQQELSEKANVAQGIISDIESGETKNPRLDTAKKLADALGCTVDDLLKDAKAV